MSKQLRRILLLSTVLVLVSDLPCFALDQAGSPPSLPKPAGVRIFSAAHSLNWYVPDILAQLASEYGIQGHQQVGLQSLGASRTIQHWELNGGKNQAQTGVGEGRRGRFHDVADPIPGPGH